MHIGNRILPLLTVCLLAAGLTTTASATSSKSKSKFRHVASSHHSARHHSARHASKRSHGQRTIDAERTIEIQNALIRAHYLDGDASGNWDQATKDAMQRYQAANGWQTKITPDSRALIKLGLGPDHKGLLNPETANIASPHELGVDSTTRPGGAADSQ